MALLLVDNLSPFTPDIVDRLKELDVSFKYATYRDAIPEGLPQCDRVILSGRRRNCKEINAANSKIARHCHESGKPLLGICYGAEIIALTFGGSIRRMPSHVQGHATIAMKQSNALTLGKETISVYESHAYCIARLPTGFRSLARSQNCENELIAHGDRNIFGTQFHPEKSGQDGKEILKNFVAL